MVTSPGEGAANRLIEYVDLPLAAKFEVVMDLRLNGHWADIRDTNIFSFVYLQ